MALDWSNERYVRVYTRDTEDDLLLSWEATAVWHAVMRKVDRAGVLEAKRGAKSVALVTRIPLDVVERALPELLADGRIVEHELGYVIRNFIEAQETPQSDRQRAIESRARRRDRGRSETSPDEGDRHETNAPVTERDGDVTNRDSSVTPCHAESRDVTSCHSDPSVPSQTDPDQTDQRERVSTSPSARRRPTRGFSQAERDAAMAVLRKLGELTGIAYRGGDGHTKLIMARYRDGLDELDLRKVIAYCARSKSDGGKGWADDPKMSEFLRPETLFGPETIERYLDAARSWFAQRIGGDPQPSAEFLAWREANEPQPRLAVVK